MAGEGEEPQARLDFRSPEEFRLACRALAGRLHYLNRVAMGESHFVWEIAELLSRIGATFEAHHDDKETNAAFGDGWSEGTLSREEARAHLLALIGESR